MYAPARVSNCSYLLLACASQLIEHIVSDYQIIALESAIQIGMSKSLFQ